MFHVKHSGFRDGSKLLSGLRSTQGTKSFTWNTTQVPWKYKKFHVKHLTKGPTAECEPAVFHVKPFAVDGLAVRFSGW